jgi:hypothetical protein
MFVIVMVDFVHLGTGKMCKMAVVQTLDRHAD